MNSTPGPSVTPAGGMDTAAVEAPKSFSRNTALKALLSRINDYLRPAEQAQPEPAPLRYPLILLVGAPRSGTTLFMQWLQSTGRITVPTNLVSRFYAAPAFAMMLQRLLFDPAYRYRDEPDLPIPESTGFGSDLGKTRGALGQNSLFFLWRQFIPIAEASRLPDAELARIDEEGLRRAVRRFASEAEGPLAMKAYLVQYHLRLLAHALDRVLFVHITREPTAVMSSLLQVRRQLHGDEGHWWGCRPPGIEALMDADPAVQVAGQVALTDKSIRDELAALPAQAQIQVRYEDLCADPAGVWARLRASIVRASADPADAARQLGADYVGPASFRRSEMGPEGLARLEAAWAEVARP